jgi:hypothetical protein
MILSQRVLAAVSLGGITNELIDPDLVINRNEKGEEIGKDAYIVVGTGDFASNYMALAVSSENRNMTLTIEHAGICETKSAGSFTPVDSPNSGTNPTTSFLFYYPETITQIEFLSPQKSFTTDRDDCETSGDQTNLSGNTIHKRLTLRGMPELDDGRYGAGIFIILNSTGSSQQNSFKIKSSNSADRVGYDSKVADVIKEEYKKVDPNIGDFSFNLTNTDLPKNGYSDLRLPVTLSCKTRASQIINVSFYDVDEGVWQNINGNNGVGEYKFPRLTMSLWEKDRGSSGGFTRSTSQNSFWHIDGGNNVWKDINNITLRRDKNYEFRVNGLARPNALTFKVSGEGGTNISITDSDVECPPAVVCEISYPDAVIKNERFNIKLKITNRSNKNLVFQANDMARASIGLIDPGSSADAQTRTGQPNAQGGNQPDRTTRWREMQKIGVDTTSTGFDRFRDPSDNELKRRITKDATRVVSAGESTTFRFSALAPNEAGNFGIGFRVRDTDLPDDWISLKSGDGCTEVVRVVNNPPPTNWKYNHEDFGMDKARNSAQPRGTVINVSGKVVNDGEGRGDNYNYGFEVQLVSKGTSLADTSWSGVGDRWLNQNRLDGGNSSSTRTRGYTIPSGAQIDGRVCFRAWVNPHRGQSQPTLTTTSTERKYTSPVCVYVANRPPEGQLGVICNADQSQIIVSVTNVRDPDGGNYSVGVTVPTATGSTIVTANNSGSNARTIVLNPASFPANYGGESSTRTVLLEIEDQDGAVARRTFVYTCYPVPVCEITSGNYVTGEPFRLQLNLRNNSSAEMTLAGGNASYRLFNSAGSQVATGIVNTVGLIIPAKDAVLVDSPEISIQASGTYTARWVVPVYPGASAAPVKEAVGDCGLAATGASIDISSKPYVRFYGNDVIAGGGYGDCTVNATNAGASGVFVPASTTIASNYRGSASELAVFAAGSISGVFPGANNDRLIGSLSFGNSRETIDETALKFGGNFGQPICADEFPDAAEWTEIIGAVNIGNSGEYKASGQITVPQTSPRDSVRTKLLVEGDIVITGNITYENASWGSIDAIPLVQLYATGNIYIDGSVTQLDGLYSAGGTIYTCTNGATAFSLSTTIRGGPAGDMLTKCGSKLTVNGALVAPNVKLHRTVGNIMSSSAGEPAGSPTIAEVFQFSPELYLALLSEGMKATSTSKFDSILSLPPAL